MKFQDELWGMRQRLKDQQENTVDPDKLRRRLDNVVQGIRTGKVSHDAKQMNQCTENVNQVSCGTEHVCLIREM